MADLTHDDFAEFFRAVHRDCEGNPLDPFEWQKRLASEIIADGWHDVIRVPTACGKTSLLDIALFELALQAEREPSEITAARRICFTIDRRLVVDDVTDHARGLYNAIQKAANGERDERVLVAVAQRLSKIAANELEPLRVVRLRGGVYRDDGWAADPLTPTILVSTVDQIGSRMLFRGYGVGFKSRPIHAGLLAFDSRVILDEAHLSTVFAATLDRVRQYAQWAEEPPLPSLRFMNVVQMSATTGESLHSFALKPEERQDELLRDRLEVNKEAELVLVNVERARKDETQARKKHLERQNRTKLVNTLVDSANRLASHDSRCAPVIGVVVNRVAVARDVLEQLRRGADGKSERDVILLTGRIRPYDRDRLLGKWLPTIKANRDSQPKQPLFVVATQTVEVGANLDFDALVTEAAPLDALRQRFGRLFRIPSRPEERPEAKAVIVCRSDQNGLDTDDRIYGPAIGRSWLCLRDLASDDVVNLAVNHFDSAYRRWSDELPRKIERDQRRRQRRREKKAKNKKRKDELDSELASKVTQILEKRFAVNAPQPDAPLLFPAHIDAWAQTSPVPIPDPDVAPFLHGKADAPGDVLVVWRADLNIDNKPSWGKIVSLMPPRSRETLSVPVYEVQAWLRQHASADIADIEGVEATSPDTNRGRELSALRWRGPKDKDTRVVRAEEVRPGDTIVVPASYGGADRYGWDPSSREPVTDVAEACVAQLAASYPESAFRRPRLRLRLHEALLPKGNLEDRDRLRTLIGSATAAARGEGLDPYPAVKKLLEATREHVNEPHKAAIDAVLGAIDTSPRSLTVDAYPQVGVAVSARLTLSLPPGQRTPLEELEHEETEDDESSNTVGQKIPLVVHAAGVEQEVVRFGQACGLGPQLVDAIRTAAHWHDEGKRDQRFQAWLHRSEFRAILALANNEALAKSGRDSSEWRASEAFGYPRGSRHEFVAVRLFDHIDFTKGDHHDLTRLLIGTHHGYGRPFPPVAKEESPVDVASAVGGKRIATSSDHGLYRLDSGWVDLFWRMVRRYGWWGLAYLETILITADRLVSAREQQQALKNNALKEPAA